MVVATSVIGDEPDVRHLFDATEYVAQLQSYLRGIQTTPASGELTTRTLTPRDQFMLGDGDVAEVMRGVGAAAVIGETPLMSSRALLRCASAELAAISPRMPIFIAANRPGRHNDRLFPFVSIADVESLFAQGLQLLVLVDYVHGCDIDSVAAAIDLRKRWPEGSMAVSCDRQSAIALRQDGFRIMPVRAAVDRKAQPSTPLAGNGEGEGLDDEQLSELAAAAFESGGNPLCCPSTTLAADELEAGDMPPSAVRSRSGELVVIRDLDRYSKLLGRRLSEEPLWWSRIATLDGDRLAQPDFHEALDVAAARAGKLGVAGEWLNMQLGTLDLSSIVSVCGSAVIVGALIAGSRGRASDALGLAERMESLRAIVDRRDSALCQAAGDASMAMGLAWVASGFDRCEAITREAVGVEKPINFIDGVGECPITVEEFERFLAEGGYQDARWWGGFPEVMGCWSEPRDWVRQIAKPTHPVAGVSWYEASAYASYRSALEGLPMVVTSFVDRRRVCGKPFPWGSELPTSCRLNYDQHVGRTSPVKTYRRGLGPAGHADLAGNVWEWCSDLANDDSAVVCGGGWYTAAAYVTSGYSYRFHRENRFDDLGFRLARIGAPA